jgi:hypothetical protein
MKTLTLLLCAGFLAVAAQSQIIHVPTDYSTIQQGINAASNGDTVLVYPGTYFENIRFGGKAITVASLFLMDGDIMHVDNTIIDGSQPVYPDSAATVMFTHGEDTTSILCGFTITGGSGLDLAEYDGRLGGGIACFFSGAKITGNKIFNNQVSHPNIAAGGGIGCFHDEGEIRIVIENNSITGNGCFANAISASGGGIFAGSNAIIRNNIITNNNCVSELANAEGGGVKAENIYGIADSVYLINNTISYNTLTTLNMARGSGVCILYSHAFLLNNSISHNSQSASIANGSGILVREAASSEIIGNTISNNLASTGNLYVGAGCLCASPLGPIHIKSNEFSFNSGPVAVSGGPGGGLAVLDGFYEKITVSGNVFDDNTAKSGGGFYSRSCYNMQVVNNLFSNNDADFGGAVVIFLPVPTELPFGPGYRSEYPLFINNTFSDNSGILQGGAIFLNGLINLPSFFNCLFHQNSSPIGMDISYVQGQNPFTISYSNLNTNSIVGFWSGEGNIFQDPLFDDTGIHPYALSAGSPCIDAGTPDTTGLNLPGTDILGNLRIWDGDGDAIERIDMGAYEFGSVVGVIESTSGGLYLTTACYPNPFAGFTTINYELATDTNVNLSINNHLGQKVSVLVNQTQSRGRHQVQWSAESMPAGIYYYHLQVENQIHSGKMILMK